MEGESTMAIKPGQEVQLRWTGDRPIARFDSGRWATVMAIKVKRIEVEIDGQRLRILPAQIAAVRG